MMNIMLISLHEVLLSNISHLRMCLLIDGLILILMHIACNLYLLKWRFL